MALRSGMRPGESLLTTTTKGFVHEALLYDGLDAFVASTAPFVRAGVDAQEPVLVVVSQRKIDALRDALGPAADQVSFADMHEVGRNPARIIPAWRDFLDQREQAPSAVRGIGEPIWFGRSEAELVECHRHEALLNVAFDDEPAFTLLCPYDIDALPASVIDEAILNHPGTAEPVNGRDLGEVY